MATWAQIWDENGVVLVDNLESPSAGALLTELDPGSPEVRAVSKDRPNRSGSLDTSMFYGSRPVSMTFSFNGFDEETARRDFMSAVMPLIDPRRRPQLVVSVPEWGDAPWRMILRADTFTAPLTRTDTNEINLTWTAPDGVWESAVPNTAQVNPAVGSTGGMMFPVSLPMTFGNGTAPSAEIITVGGVTETPPKILIYGPITNPAITLQKTGQKIQFTSTIAAGDYYEIDVDAGTILANSDSTASRFGSVNWAVSDFWLLQPGDNQIALTGSGMSNVTQATVSWRDRRL